MSVPQELRRLDGQAVTIFGFERGVVDENGVREPVVAEGVVCVGAAFFDDHEDNLDDYYPLPDDDV